MAQSNGETSVAYRAKNNALLTTLTRARAEVVIYAKLSSDDPKHVPALLKACDDMDRAERAFVRHITGADA